MPIFNAVRFIVIAFDSISETDYDLADAICQSTNRTTGPEVMFWRSMAAVAVGGVIGCLMRWFLALALNRIFPTLPPGTLAANLIGCYVIGLALALFALEPGLPMEWRLFLTTGFCGGLTTFSTFSVEVVMLLQSGRPGAALAAIAVHLVGSLAMTFAGVATMTWARG